MIRVPGLALSNTPPSPASTSCTSGESGTITATTSASRTASATDSAARAAGVDQRVDLVLAAVVADDVEPGV